MSTSHAKPAASTLEVLPKLVNVVEVLLAVRRRSPDEIDVLAVEEQLRSVFSDAERAAVADVLALLDVDVPEIIINGVRHKRVLRCEAPYMTSAGECTRPSPVRRRRWFPVKLGAAWRGWEPHWR